VTIPSKGILVHFFGIYNEFGICRRDFSVAAEVTVSRVLALHEGDYRLEAHVPGLYHYLMVLK